MASGRRVREEPGGGGGDGGGGGGATGHYHMSVKTVSRSSGRSAVAAAAYRSGEELADKRTGELHDYTRRSGVEHAEIVTPADAPEWTRDREELWNRAEAAENRKNSVTAREFEVALPSELSADDRRDLALTLAQELADRHQVAADVAIHAPGGEGDQRNHHAHILITTRQIDGDGFGAKTRELDDRSRGEVAQWRERWADMQNDMLAERGIDTRVDHRTLAEQGIERTPETHLGPHASAMEREGNGSDRGAQLAEAREAEPNPLADADARDLRDRISALPGSGEPDRILQADPEITTAREQIADARREQSGAQLAVEIAGREAEDWREEHPRRAWMHDHNIISAGPLAAFEREIDSQRETAQDAAERITDAQRAIEDREAEIAPGIRAALEPEIAEREAASVELQVRTAERELDRETERDDDRDEDRDEDRDRDDDRDDW